MHVFFSWINVIINIPLYLFVYPTKAFDLDDGGLNTKLNAHVLYSCMFSALPMMMKYSKN